MGLVTVCLEFRGVSSICYSFDSHRDRCTAGGEFYSNYSELTYGKNAKVFSTVKIWAPWNLTMGDYSTIAPDVDCYCAAPITIGSHTTVSQYSFLCAASHDFEHPNMLLTTAPIAIGDQVWVCADVFVAPGISIADGVVVGARSSVFHDLPPWMVCAGSPARPMRERKVREKEVTA